MARRPGRNGRLRSVLGATLSVGWAFAWLIPVVVALRLHAAAATVALLITIAIFVGLYVVRPLRANRRLAAMLRLRSCRRYLLALTLAAGTKLLLMLSTLALHEKLAARRMLPTMPTDEDFMAAQLLAHPLGPVALFLAIAVMAPLIEEFGFRGRVQRTLEHAFGVVPAIAASAVVFSMLHGRIDAVHHLPFGVFAGWVVWRTGSIWSAVYIHALNNAAAQLLMHLTSNAAIDWSTRAPTLWPYAMVGGLVGLGGMIAAGAWIHRIAHAERLTSHGGRPRSAAVAMAPVG